MDVRNPLAPCIMLRHYLVKHERQQKKPLTTTCKVAYLSCEGVVDNHIKKGLLPSLESLEKN